MSNTKIRNYSASWQNRSSPALARSKTNLAAAHTQKWLCGNFGIQVGDCETIVTCKTEKGHFEKASPGAWG